jgi:hypothetical protein
MDRYSPTGEDDRVIQGLMVQAFNQEAAVVRGLQADIKRKVSAALGQPDTKVDVVADAEKMSEMQAAQKYAGESLMMSVEESLMLAVDLSNMKAKNAARTTLTCNEFRELKNKSAAIISEHESAYRDDASLFMTFLNGHECIAPQIK